MKGWEPQKLEAFFVARGERMVSEIEALLDRVADHAADRFMQILESAVTTEGLKRKDGSPGRIETSEMRNAFRTAIQHNSPGAIAAEFGWLDGAEDYFLLQEWGSGNRHEPNGGPPARSVPSSEGQRNGVPAMHALWGAYIEAREELRDGLIKMGLRVNA